MRFILLCLLLPIVFGNAEFYPSFPEQYTAHGFLLLPYAEIKEPFAAYYDGELNRSRIDFYDGLVITLQKSKAAEKKSASRYGSEYMIAYESDLKGNTKKGCFKTEGSEDSEVHGQSLLPNLDGFTRIGRTRCPNALNTVQEGEILYSIEKFSKNSELFGDHPRSCELWKKKDQVGEKTSTYSFYARKDTKTGEYFPIAYIMEGFNSLLGSHYDHYVVYYTAFRSGLLNDDMFDVDKSYKCGGFPGPGAKQNKLVMNPMKAYFDNNRAVYDEHFDHYKNKHNKNYDTESEHEFRRKVFLDNSRFIHSSNRRSKTYKLSVNHLADKSEDELKVLSGRVSANGYNGGIPFSSQTKTEDLPKSIDWRLFGAVNPVKDQATCGSCWSFSTTGSIEGVNFVKTGHLLSLSEQFLVDCAWGELCNGCSGCDFPKAAQAIMNRGGIALTESYGHYLGVDGKCHANDVKKAVKLEGYVNVTSHSIEDLKKALVENGPIAVAIRAGLKTFSFYSNGVYNDPECVGDKDEDLNHAVLLVGYGTLKGQDYWLIKNSWSTYWGNDGYILIAQKNNICGVTTAANYPLISDS